MKIGIISDTHDQLNNIIKSIAFFKKEKVSLVYHLGDICSPFSIKLFKNLNCKMKAVFGNNDADIFKLLKVKPKNVSFHDRFLEDTLDNKKLAVFHGDPEEIVESIINSQKYDFILRGHNHLAEIKTVGKTLMINPGNLIGPKSGYKWTKPSIAILDSNKGAKLINID